MILILRDYLPKSFESISLNWLVAAVAISIALLVLFLEVRFESLQTSFQDLTEADEEVQRETRNSSAGIALETRALESEVRSLQETQGEFLRAIRPGVAPVVFGHGFDLAYEVCPRVGHLRIFAISSQQILSFIKFKRFRAERCSLLLHTPDPSRAHFASQIELVIKDWIGLVREGTIAQLELLRYDFHPTEYEVIYDTTFMLVGLYDSDPNDYSGVKVRDPLSVDGRQEVGHHIVTEFAARFDALFAVCRAAHGENDSVTSFRHDSGN